MGIFKSIMAKRSENNKIKREIKLLTKDLKNKDWQVRKKAAYELGETKNPLAVKPLIFALGDEDYDVRTEAEKALVKLRDFRVVERLISALRRSRKYLIRKGAARVLGEIKDKRAYEPLVIAAVLDKNEEVRWAAEDALEKITMFEWEAEEIMSKDVSLFTNEKTEIKENQQQTPDIDVSQLVRIFEMLKNKDWRVRTEAAKILGEIKDKRALEPLIKALCDENSNVRFKARSALKKIDPSWRETETAKKLVPFFIQALSNKNAEVREEAARVLGEIGDKRAVEPLIKALGDKYLEVRSAAVFSLGNIKDARAIEPLIKMLCDKNNTFRLAVVMALDEIIKLVTLGMINDEPITDLFIKYLNDKDWRIREGAAFLLGRIKNKKAVEPLIQALGDRNWRVRCSAVFSLGEIKDERAIVPLSKMIYDVNKEVAKDAEEALKKIMNFKKED